MCMGGRGGVVGEFIPHDYCYFNKAVTVGKGRFGGVALYWGLLFDP